MRDTTALNCMEVSRACLNFNVNAINTAIVTKQINVELNFLKRNEVFF